MYQTLGATALLGLLSWGIYKVYSKISVESGYNPFQYKIPNRNWKVVSRNYFKPVLEDDSFPLTVMSYNVLCDYYT